MNSDPSAIPRVSVCIGTYNCAEYLPGLWDCLEAQTFRDFEIVVVDDASSDAETLSILEAMGDKIRLIRRDTNSQTCELPRYQAARAAKAPLCAFLDADDRWDPRFLEKCVDYLDAHQEAAMVHTYVRVVDYEDRVQRIRHEGVMPTGSALPRALLEHCYITVSAVVARRDAWLEAMPEETITDFGMDLDFFLAIAKKYPIGFISEVLGSYRRSDSSVSVKKWKRIPRNIVTLKRIQVKKMHHGLASDSEMQSILVEACQENAEFWRHQGQSRRALWFCAQGLKIRPWDAGLWACAARAVGRLLVNR